ncbi:MAG TPA: phosphate ABC transporter permease subunit PstC [Gemmataceae bacterium]|nr:phosphate ABC transporter permease subunit PstC [Gemmataceae bacterium]
MTAHTTKPEPESAAGQVAPWRAKQSLSVFDHLGDWCFRLLCQSGAVLVILLAASLLLVLLWKSWLAIQSVGGRFLTTTTWDPEPTHRLFGALAFIYGTVATSTVAMLIAVPLGVGTAAYLSEIAPGWLKRSGSFFVEMLAAVPSVVYGFWGLFVLSPALHRLGRFLGNPDWGGIGILPAGIVLAIMIVPYVAAVSYDVCRAVPSAQREGSLALGASRWQTIWRVVLPYARPGIVGGCFIALGRALGETMAVTMLIGNRTEISLSPFAMGNSIASVIANEFTEATYDLYLSALAELGLVLLLVSVIVNSLARLLIWRVSRVRHITSFFAGRLRVTSKQAPRQTSTTANDQMAEETPPPPLRPSQRTRRRTHWIDRTMTVVLGACLFATLLPLFFILGHLVYEGISALNWQFFVNLPAPVGQTGGGMANALYGSALLVALATAFAVPIGLLAAIFLAEYRSGRLGRTVRFVGELLGGVPSIVVGIFAYTLVVKPLGHFSGWAGGFALGVMMIPIVMRASEEALKLVPGTIRDASHALGAKHYQTVLRVTIPAALPAIITAVFLAIARVAGETAPLLLTASSNQYWPRSPGDFTPSLPVYIFTYAVSPYDDWHRQAWAAALVLLAVVMILNFGVRFATGKRVLLASRSG